MNYQTPVWLDNLTLATKGDKEKHRKNVSKILKKLQEAIKITDIK